MLDDDESNGEVPLINNIKLSEIRQAHESRRCINFFGAYTLNFTTIDLPPMFVPPVMLVRQARGQGRQAKGPQAPEHHALPHPGLWRLQINTDPEPGPAAARGFG